MRKSIKKLFRRQKSEERGKPETTDLPTASSSLLDPRNPGEQAGSDQGDHESAVATVQFSTQREHLDAKPLASNLRQPESDGPPPQSLTLVPVGVQNVYSPDAVTEARAALWEKAYKTLQADKPDLLLNWESIIKDDADLSQDLDLFSSAAIAKVVSTQKMRMENKQWTIHWFDKKVKVRDTIESILSTVQSASPIIAAGMNFAPAFVSLPWSFVSIILPFVTREFSEMHAAIDGLKDVACILSSYNTAEQEFLANSVTRDGFQKEVLNLYVNILEYQALAAQHFAVSTIKRLGRNLYPGSKWQDALNDVKKAEGLCRVPIDGLAIRLQQTSFRSLEDLLKQNANFMVSRQDESFVRRTQNERVIEWISTINAVQDHAEIRRRLGDDYVGSGQWLLSGNKDFQSWLRSSSTKLLLQGVVGTGKSSLVSMVLEHLMTRADGQLAFNYCSAASSSWDPINTVRNDTTNIFRSILAQCALLTDGSIAKPLTEAFHKSKNQGPGQSELSLDTTIELLRAVLNSRDDQVTMVFDALDELSDHDKFLESLRAIHVPEKKLRVFFSSRHGIDITYMFPETVKIPIASQTATDISNFIESEIEKRWHRSGIMESQAVRLKDALKTWSEGVFRWVSMELEIFLPPSRRQGSRVRPADFEARLRKLERSRAPAVDRLFLAYDQIYQDALGDEDEISRRRIVNTTMKWVLCTFRPFNVAELVSVVSCSLVVAQEEIDDSKSGDDSSRVEYRDTDPVSGEDLFAYCANFITATKEGIVRLAHLSVRQYFERNRVEDFNPAQQHLEAALLSIKVMSGRVKGSDKASVADYHSKLWPIHARAAAASPELEMLLNSDELLKRLEADDVGLKIALGNDLQERDCLGNTILHDAILNGSLEDVELIIQVDTLFQQASPLVKQRNLSGDTPLHVAASHGVEGIFTALVHAGSSVNEQNDFGLTPLHMAVLFGQDNIIRAATQFGWDLEAPDGTGGTLLHTAALCDAKDIGRMLIGSGMGISEKNQENRTALEIAREYSFDFSIIMENVTKANRRHPGGIKSTARPKIYVESPSTCRYCNIEEWLEGSRQGFRYLHSPSLTVLEDSAGNCDLCDYLCTSVRKLISAQGGIYNSDAEPRYITVGVALAADSKNEIAIQDLLSVYYGRSIAGQLELCVESDDLSRTPELSFMLGRYTYGFKHSMKLVKEWLESCRRDHKFCVMGTAPSSSIRLLEINEYESRYPLRLVHSGDIEPDQRRYACLSFTWGNPAHIPVTRHNNVAQRSDIGLSMEELPQLFRDVVGVCRFLKYRYIFIDALCIVQDSADEKQRQDSMMHGILTGADLVIASTGQDVRYPLSDDRTLASHTAQFKSRLSSSKDCFNLYLRETFPTARDVMHNTVLDRSWKAQEALLAGRLLFFNSDYPMWNCAELLRTEASAKTQDPLFHNIPWLVAMVYGELWTNQKYSKWFTYSEWYRYVEMISSGSLMNLEDLLPASEAVALAVNAIVAHIPGEIENVLQHYHQGIRVDDIHRSLLWINKNATEYKYNSRSAPTIASWSWASRMGWKSYRLVNSFQPHPDGISTDPVDLQWLRIDKGDNGTWENTFRGIYDQLFQPRLMLVRAQVRLLSSKETIRMYDLIFDTSDFRGSWRAGQRFLFMVVTRWAYNTSKHGHRWIGLILQKSEQLHEFGGGESDNENFHDRTGDKEPEKRRFPERYVRAGLFLGPKCENGLADWSEQTISLV